MEQICDMCKKRGYLFPCSGCGLFKYCSPRCQTNHLPKHEEDCKKTRSSGWTGNEYKPFSENEKIIFFLSAFSYHCRLKNPNYLPECTVDTQNGIFLAILAENSPLERDDMVKIDQEKSTEIAIGFNEPGTTFYNFNVTIFPVKTARTMYSLYKSLFDVAVSIQFQVYKPDSFPEGMKEGAILVIYTNKEGDQKLAYV